VEIALEEEGIPVFSVHADMVDARLWDADKMRRDASRFLDQVERK
jgi:hypothetical protein